MSKGIVVGTRVIAFENEGAMSQLFTVNRRRKYFGKLGTVHEVQQGTVAPYMVEFDEHPKDGLIAFAENALTVI